MLSAQTFSLGLTNVPFVDMLKNILQSWRCMRLYTDTKHSA